MCPHKPASKACLPVADPAEVSLYQRRAGVWEPKTRKIMDIVAGSSPILRLVILLSLNQTGETMERFNEMLQVVFTSGYNIADDNLVNNSRKIQLHD